jgi:penicillin-binding protein 1B
MLLLVVVGAGALLRALSDLDAQVEERFRGRLFAVPSTIYSAPLVLYSGLDVGRAGIVERLDRLRYRPVSGPGVTLGEYARLADRIRIGRRSFAYPHRIDAGGVLDLLLDEEDRIAELRDASGSAVPVAELEPEVIAQIHGPSRADRRLARLEQVPPVLVRAILAVEDQRFYEHSGIDVRRIVGAMLANLRAARIVQGASTLTQQLVKNFYLTPERTFRRKLREAAMALLLERDHTKEEILEAYLNEVYLGQRGSVAIHGVGEGAFHYFSKEIGQITLSESAMLAGLITGPSLYSPYTHPEAARERRDLVLEILLEREWISEGELEAAASEPVSVESPPLEANRAPYFVDHLRRDLAGVYGEDLLESEGLSIHTTLDPQAQEYANRAVANGLRRLEDRLPLLPPAPDDTPLQAALLALNPRTGEILALVGGRNYGRSQFNRATQARRQPGSVFKPIVALAALARRSDEPPSHTLVSPLLDEPLEVASAGGVWSPANYDEEFRGPVTLRQAIEQSLNVPVARLGLEVGLERIIATAQRLGLAGRLDPVPSLALGVFEVTLLEAARAYAVFATAGVRPTLRTYAEVMDAEGTVLERQSLDFERVFTPEETYLVTSALEGVVDRGTGRGLRRLGFDGAVAAKTGTTSAYRDAWFVAYVPDLLVAAWVGFDDERSHDMPGSVAALPMVAEFLLNTVGPEGRGDLPRPPGIVMAAVAAPPGPLGEVVDHPLQVEFFLPGTEPRTEGEGGVRRIVDWLRGRL